MDAKNKKAYSFSIVLIGNFSPPMFQPYWFKHCGILDDNEFDAIEKNKDRLVVTSTITSFETDNFLFRIEGKRFTLIAKREPFELLIDAFVKLREKLDSVLIEKFGLNYSFHVELENAENMKKFGDVLTPKTYWEVLFEGAIDSPDNTSGLASLTMKKITDFGCVNVKVESSSHFKNAIFFDYNFHFDGNSEEPYDILDVSEIVVERFQEFMDYSNEVSSRLIESVFNDVK